MLQFARKWVKRYPNGLSESMNPVTLQNARSTLPPAWKKSPESHKNYYVNQYVIDNKGIKVYLLIFQLF